MGRMSRWGGRRWCPRCTAWWLQRSVITEEEGAALAWRVSRQDARGASTYRNCPTAAWASLCLQPCSIPGLPGAEGNWCCTSSKPQVAEMQWHSAGFGLGGEFPTPQVSHGSFNSFFFCVLAVGIAQEEIQGGLGSGWDWCSVSQRSWPRVGKSYVQAMKCGLLHNCQEVMFAMLEGAKKPSKGDYLLLWVDTAVLWGCKLARRTNKQWSSIKHQVPGSIPDWGNWSDLLWENCAEHWKTKQLPTGMAGFL